MQRSIVLLVNGAEAKKRLLIVVSALLCIVPFYVPTLFCWLILCYMIPIFYGVICGYRFTFMDGFVWGIIFFGLHLMGVLVLLCGHLEQTYVAFGAYTLLTCYYASLTGLYFAMANK